MTKEKIINLEEIEAHLSEDISTNKKIDYLTSLLKKEEINNKLKIKIGKILQELYSSKGEHRKAAELWESLGNYKEAIRLYQYIDTIDGYKDDSKKIAELKKKYKRSSIGIRVGVILSILSFGICFFFILPNITGNVIINIDKGTSNWFGFLFFLAGLGLSLMSFIKGQF